MKISTKLANTYLASGLATAFDGGTGIIEGRTGAAPATADDALSGTVVATLPVPSDALGAPSGNTVAGASMPWEDTSADATGVIGYWVLRLSGDTTGASAAVPRILFTTGEGSGEFNFDNLDINARQSVALDSLTLTQPLS